MRVRVLFFGLLKEFAGRASDELDLPDGARLEDLFTHYARTSTRLAEFRASVAASVNHEYADWNTPLRPGDEVAFLPPVSGGEATPQSAAEDIIELRRSALPIAELAARVKSPPDGAVASFDGIVRNFSRIRTPSGDFERRETLYLEYEAYEAMALAKMREIAAEIHRRFDVHRVAIVHRLGRLEIGDTSIFIAVSAAHRAPALDACRFAIDTLKKIVPIWKKEFFADGAVWADGEFPAAKPFPAPANPTSR